MLDPLLLSAAGRALTETLTTTPDSDERLMRQHERRELTRMVAPDGMIRYLGWFDPEADATIFAALGPLATPRPAAEGVPDPRSPGQRNADALLDLARIGLAAGDLPQSGGVKPTMNVTINLAAVQRELAGAGLLSSGDVLSAAAARRVACDAKIIPIVLGGASPAIWCCSAWTTTTPCTIRAGQLPSNPTACRPFDPHAGSILTAHRGDTTATPCGNSASTSADTTRPTRRVEDRACQRELLSETPGKQYEPAGER